MLEIQNWFQSIHATWIQKGLVVPTFVLGELNTRCEKRMQAISSMHPSPENLISFRNLLPDREQEKPPETPPTRYEVFSKWAKNNWLIASLMILVGVIATVGGALDAASKGWSAIYKYFHPNSHATTMTELPKSK